MKEKDMARTYKYTKLGLKGLIAVWTFRGKGNVRT